MRKYFYVLIAAAVCFGMTACSEDDPVMPDNTEVAPEETEPEEGTPEQEEEGENSESENEEAPGTAEEAEALEVRIDPEDVADNDPVYGSLTDAEITAGAQAFAWNFLKVAPADKDNKLVSPISAFLLTSMLENGARGNIREELAHVLGFPNGINPSDLNRYNKNLVGQLCSTRATVAVANKVWIDPNFLVQKKFMDDMAEYYNAPLDALIHSTIQDDVNKWCDENTFGLIKEVKISDPEFLTYFIANATYYKNSWTDSYLEKNTVILPFTNLDGAKVDVEMMTANHFWVYAENSYCAFVKQPMGDDRKFTFFTALPAEGVSVNACINSLASGDWTSLYKSDQRKLVKILMPKFDAAAEFDMNSVLNTLGVKTGDGDLKKMYNGGGSINMKQKTRCIVNENGVEAAAFSYSDDAWFMPGGEEPQPLVYSLDRPFVYGIVHEDTGTILFLGVVATLPDVTASGAN